MSNINDRAQESCIQLGELIRQTRNGKDIGKNVNLLLILTNAERVIDEMRDILKYESRK